MKKLTYGCIAAIALVFSLIQPAAAHNAIVFAEDARNCGGQVMCSRDGTKGYLVNGQGRPFKASTIAAWFQIDVDGRSHLKGQPAESLAESGSFLVVNDTGRPISLFALPLAVDFDSRTVPVRDCRGEHSGKPCSAFISEGGNGSYKYTAQLSGGDLDKCTSGKARRRLCLGSRAKAEFAPGRVSFSWRAKRDGNVPNGASFVISFSGWVTNAWAGSRPDGVSLLSLGAGFACCGGLSPNGSFVAFHDYGSPVAEHIYDVDAASFTSFETPIPNGSAQDVAISNDGNVLVQGGGSQVGNVYVFDVAAGTTKTISVPLSYSSAASISGDGRYVAYQSGNSDCDADECLLTYVYDRTADTTTQLLAPGGGLPNNTGCQPVGHSISGGEFIAVGCSADNLVEGVTYPSFYSWDQFTNTFQVLERSTAGGEGIPGGGSTAGISSNERYMIFNTPATNLVAGGTTGNQVFVYDQFSQAVQLVSAASDGTQANNGDTPQYATSVSADGRYAVFASTATNLVSGIDNTGDYQVYLKDLQTGEIQQLSVDGAGRAIHGENHAAMISNNGRTVVFSSNGEVVLVQIP